MTRASLIAWLEAHGYAVDRYGHHVKETPSGKRYRMRLSSTWLTREIQVVFSDGSKAWTRSCSAPISRLSLTADGKLAGLQR